MSDSGGARLWVFQAPRELLDQMVPKGSVAVDGVSLTLVDAGAGRFSVALIPTPRRETTLGSLRVGDRVNGETDLLGEVIDGAEAERRGLVWRCVEDGHALQEALRLAAGILKAPRDLVCRTKATLRDMAGIAEHEAAVERELEAQLWSIGQPEFDVRIAALKRRLPERKPRSS